NPEAFREPLIATILLKVAAIRDGSMSSFPQIGDVAPRASVLMTTYNGAPFIRQSIDSVLAQSFRDFELIVVDDGSVDATAEILDSYGDPRLRVIRNDRNLGI